VAENLDAEFAACLKAGRIRPFPAGPEIATAEMRSARQDLDEARRTLGTGGHKWSTIQAYYSMFHTARALIYAMSFRERSHRCLIVALRTLYVTAGKLESDFVEGLQAGKMLRENADYYSNFSEAGATKAVELASKFFIRAQGLTGAE